MHQNGSRCFHIRGTTIRGRSRKSYEQKNIEINNSREFKSNILIIGDETTRNKASVLKNTMDVDKYIIEGSVKANIELEELTKTLFHDTFYHNDYVIVIFNTRNISNTKTLNWALNNLLSVSRYTNLITV